MTEPPAPGEQAEASWRVLRASVVRTSGLCGQCSHGPCTERERAAITMCPVAGPAVPPTAVTKYSQPSCHSSLGPSGAKFSVIQWSG